jgi:hypothetical protein
MGVGLLCEAAGQTEMSRQGTAMAALLRMHKLLCVMLGTTFVVSLQGCDALSGKPSIEGTWTCTTTNHLSGKKNEDRFVFGPANKWTLEVPTPMHGTYEVAGTAITLTLLEIPAMAQMGLSSAVRNEFKGTINKLTSSELVLETVTAKGVRRTSVCTRQQATADKQAGSSQSTASALSAAEKPNPVPQGMPELPDASADPKPMSAAIGFPGIAAKKGTGIFELIGATPGLEDQINALTKDKSSVFFSRLTGPGGDITPAGAGAVFGTACMAHSCDDSAALYVRDNGAVAVVYIDTNSNELFHFSNIDQKQGIPESVRLFVEEAMKQSPGLTLRGIQTTNGNTKVPAKAAETPPIKEPPPPMPQSQQRPPATQPSGKDTVARYADNLAAGLDRASHPACRSLASNIRSLGNSGAPDHVRQRQVDAIIERAPSICF